MRDGSTGTARGGDQVVHRGAIVGIGGSEAVQEPAVPAHHEVSAELERVVNPDCPRPVGGTLAEYAGGKAGFPDVEQPIEGETRQEVFAQKVLPEVEVLLRVARSLTRHPADAEDLVQDTLLRAFRAIERFDGRHPRAWLLTILRNTHANRGRERRPEVVSDVEATWAAAPAAEEPESVVLRGAFDASVERAFRALPEKFRLVVELVDLGGLSYQEVAVTLDIPIGTVMSRLHRGRGRIRAALEAAGLPGGKED